MQQDHDKGSIDKGTNPEINPERNRDRMSNPGADRGAGSKPTPAPDRKVIQDPRPDRIDDESERQRRS